MTAISPARASAVGGAALWAILALPPLRRMLEAEAALQMIVQLPLLGLIGALIAQPWRRAEPGWLRAADWLGLPGVTVALFAMAFWMLPRSLDGALGDPRLEAAKFIALPLLAGLPLAASWQRLPALGRGFLGANLISMLGTVGGLYLAAPVRLCAYYRLDQQAVAGRALIAAAAACGLLWLLAALFGWRLATGLPPQAGRSGPFDCGAVRQGEVWPTSGLWVEQSTGRAHNRGAPAEREGRDVGTSEIAGRRAAQGEPEKHAPSRPEPGAYRAKLETG